MVMKPLCHHEYGNNISHYVEGWGILSAAYIQRKGEGDRRGNRGKLRVLYSCQYG